MIVVVDNYDSFTWNLVHLLARHAARPHVVAANAPDLADIVARARILVISPGPGRPEDATGSLLALRATLGRIPVLGVCLGHQCLAHIMGAKVVRTTPRHGKPSLVTHDRKWPFENVPSPFAAIRYHSLAVATNSLPADLELAGIADDGTSMAVRAHVGPPTLGLQFHPESVASQCGETIVQAFLNACAYGVRGG